MHLKESVCERFSYHFLENSMWLGPVKGINNKTAFWENFYLCKTFSLNLTRLSRIWTRKVGANRQKKRSFVRKTGISDIKKYALLMRGYLACIKIKFYENQHIQKDLATWFNASNHYNLICNLDLIFGKPWKCLVNLACRQLD